MFVVQGLRYIGVFVIWGSPSYRGPRYIRVLYTPVPVPLSYQGLRYIGVSVITASLLFQGFRFYRGVCYNGVYVVSGSPLYRGSTVFKFYSNKTSPVIHFNSRLSLTQAHDDNKQKNSVLKIDDCICVWSMCTHVTICNTCLLKQKVYRHG